MRILLRDLMRKVYFVKKREVTKWEEKKEQRKKKRTVQFLGGFRVKEEEKKNRVLTRVK